MRKCGELPLLKKITIRREQVEDWESYPFSIPIIRCLEELASDLGFVFSRERMARESLPCWKPSPLTRASWTLGTASEFPIRGRTSRFANYPFGIPPSPKLALTCPFHPRKIRHE